MLNNKDNEKPTGGLTYPPQAHVRTPRSSDPIAAHPENSQKQQGSRKYVSLEWLEEADRFEPPPKEDPQRKDQPEEDSKKQGSSEVSESLAWLVEADNYNPPKQS
ncbi:hypothetical protein NUW58_g2567 [Xylaria curta]|uniref:Uncharacterized protein n=1 Tax=Xylaria curta TaxID=42375 RepID=A0ACC1PI52_9PEZI|nr:hypothetical protein NUW58_g2567 [Xylaria curta]